MPSVLLTRPCKDSERLAWRLEQLGYTCFIEPLLTIEPIFTPVPVLDHVQAVMVTSSNAFDGLDRITCEKKGLLRLPCFCVGSTTAEAARAFGFASVQDASGDGLALANRIQSMLRAKGGPILHICGRDIDSKGRNALEAAGYDVESWTVYAAKATEAFSSSALALWRGQKLDAVLLFSARTAEILKALMHRHEIEACCAGVIALGISDAVTAALDGLSWRHLASASSPAEADMLRRLQELLPV